MHNRKCELRSTRWYLSQAMGLSPTATAMERMITQKRCRKRPNAPNGCWSFQRRAFGNTENDYDRISPRRPHRLCATYWPPSCGLTSLEREQLACPGAGMWQPVSELRPTYGNGSNLRCQQNTWATWLSSREASSTSLTSRQKIGKF